MKFTIAISQWFKDLKLGKKIFYTFIIATLIPMLILQGSMLYVISNNMRDKVDDLMISQLKQTAERTELSLEIYTNLVYQIYSDNQIIDAINRYQMAGEEKEKIYRDVNSQLQQYGVSVSGISCISIILENGQDITYDFKRASAVDNLWNGYTDLREIEPYQRVQADNNMVISPTMHFTDSGTEERLFHISKRMYDFNDIEDGAIATIVMSIEEDVLNRICAMNQSADEQEVYTINFITDQEGNVISYPDSFYAGITIKRDVEEFVRITGQLKGKTTEMNQYVDKKLGWTFYNVYDKDYILRDIRSTQYITLLLGLVIMAFSLLLIRYTTKLIQQSTESIVGGIKEVQQGNLAVQVEVSGKDEMGQIANNFNTMTKKVQELIVEVSDATERQKDAEIRALEAQINPHFLYNTLDSINWMAIEKHEYEISKMLRNLGIILRYSVNRSNKMATIEEVGDWLDKYISLQKMRFNDAFSYQINIAHEAEKAVIHKLLLQPFIENAIVHGFKGITIGGMLRIDIMLSEERDQIHIFIEDNGNGMTQEKAAKFKLSAIIQDAGKSIGMQNAFSRIYMYYGERASWNIHSREGLGTVITLKIPVEKGE